MFRYSPPLPCRIRDPHKPRRFFFGDLLSITAEDVATVLAVGGRVVQNDRSQVALAQGQLR